MGDWNTEVREQHTYPVTGKFGLDDGDDRAQTQVEFCCASKLVITNTLFEHSDRSLYTWKSRGNIPRDQAS